MPGAGEMHHIARTGA